MVAACKVIAITSATADKEKKTIQKEIQVHSALKHENIIRLKEAFVLDDDGRTKYTPGAYLLLEMAHGGDLFDKIGRILTYNCAQLTSDSSGRWSGR